jgi:pimeloyl-ACP methyl ester carboxylesterase/DNA-binding CsgD family transcriptional regulator
MDAPPVQYVRTSDGYSIAYTVSGSGRPVVFLPVPFNHVQYDWESPAAGPWLTALSERFMLVRYDSRGQGLSTRGLRDELSLADYERDLETVVDNLRLDRFVLLAHTVFGRVAIRYATSSRERVEALVLVNSATRNRPSSTVLNLDLARENWEVFLQAAMASPDWSPDQRRAAVVRFGQSSNQADWLRQYAVLAESDVEDRASMLSLPVLVLYARDLVGPAAESSQALAGLIPNARLALIDGSSLMGDGEAGARAVEAFLAELSQTSRLAAGSPSGGPSQGLSTREVEVLRLLAAGKSNGQIADELVISQNTVIRHVSNIFAKIGAANRAEAASYATRHGIA